MRRLAGLAACVAIAVAAALLVLAAIETSQLAAFADDLAPDGRATKFSEPVLGQFKQRAPILALAWLGIAASFAVVARFAPISRAPRSPRALLIAAWAAVRGFVRSEPLHSGALGVLLLVHAVACLSLLDQPIRTDEAITWLNFVSGGWLGTFIPYATNNHVLNSMLARGCCTFVTDPSLCLRLPALLAGLALPLAAYVSVRVHLGRSVALVTSAALTGHVYAVDFATNGRAYTAITLIFLLLLALAPRLSRPGSIGPWLAFVALTVLGFLFVPVMAYPAAIVGAWLALGILLRGDGELALDLRHAWRLIGAAVAVLAGVVAVYTPMLLTSGLGAVHANEVIEQSRHAVENQLLETAAVDARRVWRDWSEGLPQAIRWAALALAVLGGLAGGAGAGRLFAATLLGISAIFFVTRAPPPTWIFLFALPIYLALAAAGGRRLLLAAGVRSPAWQTRLTLAAATACLAANVVIVSRLESPSTLRWYVGYPDARASAEELDRVLGPRDRIVCHKIVGPPILFHLRLLGDPDPWYRIEFDGSEGDRYLVLTEEPDVGSLLLALRADPSLAEASVIELPTSRILHFERRSPARPGAGRRGSDVTGEAGRSYTRR